MTARLCWEGLLTELSKVNAPSILLSEFNYYFNKAINLYINKRYNIYDVNLNLTDDLRVLKATSILKPKKVFDNSDNFSSNYENITGDLSLKELSDYGITNLYNGTYEVNLPLDYLHLLNCICVYKLNEKHKCYDKGDTVLFSAKRLTSDAWSVIVNDYYNRPLPERPYYYIHNVNTSSDLPTNPINKDILHRGLKGTDPNIKVPEYKPNTKIGDLYNESIGYTVETFVDSDLRTYYTLDDTTDKHYCKLNSEYTKIEDMVYNKDQATQLPSTLRSLPNKIDISGLVRSSVEKEAGVRYGNSSNVRMEIRYGQDSSVFKLVAVLVDYIKAPLTIRLTQTLVNLTQDTSLIMEYPDYVCQEIINELVHLVMERTGDPRLQTHAVVTESIGNPAQQLAQPTPQQRG